MSLNRPSRARSYSRDLRPPGRSVRNEDDQVVWMWRDKGKKPVGTPETSSMRATVRELSGLLSRQATAAIGQLSVFMKNPKQPVLQPLVTPKKN